MTRLHRSTRAGSLRTAMALAVWAGMIVASTERPADVEPPWDERVSDFSLPEPETSSSSDSRPFLVWSTHYFIPIVSAADPDDPDSYALLNTLGREISPRLKREDWCDGVLQGSIHIRSPTGELRSYAYVDSKGPDQADCDRWLGRLSDNIKLASRRARFKPLASPLDCDGRARPLTPFRTIAVDPDFIRLGSVLYISELSGQRFRLNGRDMTHDGYLIADDYGGAVERNQIDLFTAGEEKSPLPDIVTNTPKMTVSAAIVPADSAEALALKQALSEQCRPQADQSAPLDR